MCKTNELLYCHLASQSFNSSILDTIPVEWHATIYTYCVKNTVIGVYDIIFHNLIDVNLR